MTRAVARRFAGLLLLAALAVGAVSMGDDHVRYGCDAVAR